MKKLKFIIALLFITTSIFAQGQNLGGNEYFQKNLFNPLTSSTVAPRYQFDLLPFGNQLGNVGATGTRFNFIYGDSTITNYLLATDNHNQFGAAGGTVPSDMATNGHLFRTSSGGNVATFQSMDTAGYSALRFVNNLGNEFTALGFGNASTGLPYQSSAFWEGLNPTLGGTTFTPMKILGTYTSGVGSPSSLVRTLWDSDGSILFSYQPPQGFAANTSTIKVDSATIDFVTKSKINLTTKGIELITPSAGQDAYLQLGQTARGTFVIGSQASGSAPSNMVIASDVAAPIIFKYSSTLGNLSTGTESMRINPNGELQIGSSSDLGAYKLQTSGLGIISGSAQFNGVLTIVNDRNTNDVNHGILNLTNSSSSVLGNDIRIMFVNVDQPIASMGASVEAAQAGALVFNTRQDAATYSEKMRITSGGNVGVNTTNPLAKFHDNGTAMFGAGTGASLTDSSLVVNYSTGSPVLNWYGTNGNTWNIGINTSDGATFNGATTYNFDNNMLFADPGTSANSYSISLVADNATTTQTGTIQVNYGASPYMRFSPPNAAGTATAFIDLKSNQMIFPDSTSLTTNTGASDVMLFKAVDNDDSLLYEVARLSGGTTPTFDILAGKLTGALSGNSQNITGVGQLAATTYGSDGTVSDAELLYINTLSSNAQTQINAKVSSSSFITASRVYDCGSVAAGVDSVFSITATGAVAGNPVSVGVTVAAEATLIITAECTTNDVVTVRISNHGLVSAVDPVSRTYKVMVSNL